MNDKNEKILNKIDELSEIRPEDDYQKKLEEEDSEALEKARYKLMTLISMKCKGAPAGMVDGQIRPMVYSMNISDCENMTEIIRKKGLFGLM